LYSKKIYHASIYTLFFNLQRYEKYIYKKKNNLPNGSFLPIKYSLSTKRKYIFFLQTGCGEIYFQFSTLVFQFFRTFAPRNFIQKETKKLS